MKKLKAMTKEFINFYANNIDKNSKPLKGTIKFWNGPKIKISLWPFVLINRND